MQQIKVKQMHVMQKITSENGTYGYQKTIIPVNRIMTTSEFKNLQKQTAINFNVPQNMVGGICETIE